MQARSDSNLWGADVSHHNGNINWPKAAEAGLQFAFIKASEGVGMMDDMLRRNALGADAVGIPAGFYHYGHPELNDAAREAMNFAAAIDGLPRKLPLVLDIEDDAAKVDRETLTAWCDDFLQRVQQLTGTDRVGIYTGAYFARDNLGPTLGKYFLWIAHYGAETPLYNGTWPTWSVFQYGDHGSCPGIGEGTVDMNVMEADFYRECLAPAEPKPTKGDGNEMKAEDASKIVAVLQAAYALDVRDANGTPIDRAELHRLAGVTRTAGGLPIEA